MRKICMSVLLTALFLFTLTDCGKKEAASAIRLGGLKGPTTMGMVKLLSDAEEGNTKNRYDFTMAASADELTPAFLKGELDIIAVPANLGAVLYQKSGGEVQMAAINALGVLYIVETGGEEIRSLQDLKGRTLYATGKGSTPEMVLRYLLSRNGLDMDRDLSVEWKSEPSETVAQMAVDGKAVALLPEPFVTVAMGKLPDLRRAVDLQAEWNEKESGSELLTAALFVRKEFAEREPEKLKIFLEEYGSSAEYVRENLEEAAVLVEKYGIVAKEVAEKAIPGCNIVCITGEEMKKAAEGYFSVLFEQNEASVGGKLPDEGFYRIDE